MFPVVTAPSRYQTQALYWWNHNEVIFWGNLGSERFHHRTKPCLPTQLGRTSMTGLFFSCRVGVVCSKEFGLSGPTPKEIRAALVLANFSLESEIRGLAINFDPEI